MLEHRVFALCLALALVGVLAPVELAAAPAYTHDPAMAREGD
jgi:hypothetical protein